MGPPEPTQPLSFSAIETRGVVQKPLDSHSLTLEA
jgi:hypothetical protein